MTRLACSTDEALVLCRDRGSEPRTEIMRRSEGFNGDLRVRYQVNERVTSSYDPDAGAKVPLRVRPQAADDVVRGDRGAVARRAMMYGSVAAIHGSRSNPTV